MLTNKQVAELGRKMQQVVVLGQAAIADFAMAKTSLLFSVQLFTGGHNVLNDIMDAHGTATDPQGR